MKIKIKDMSENLVKKICTYIPYCENCPLGYRDKSGYMRCYWDKRTFLKNVSVDVSYEIIKKFCK